MCKPSDDGLREVESNRNSEEKPHPSVPVVEQIAKWGTLYLHISPKFRICYYILLVIVMSIISECVQIPHVAILTAKKSILNQMFVKLGWLWTFMIFSIYNVVSLAIHKDRIKKVKNFVVRLMVTSFFFSLWCTVTFPTIEKYFGECLYEGKVYDFTKKECLKLGHEYVSFDISGHSFLLIYCIMIIMEESQDILYFLKLSRQVRGAPIEDNEKPVPNNDVKALRDVFKIMSPFVIVAYVSMVLISLLWDFMLIVTTIYYHSLAEKLIGTLLALLMWHVLYQRLFNILEDLLK